MHRITKTAILAWMNQLTNAQATISICCYGSDLYKK